MPAPFEFPGHYWDEAKGKFFKIESTGTAPQGAQWSQSQVAVQSRRQRYVNERQQRRDRIAARSSNGAANGGPEDESSKGSSGSRGRGAKRRHNKPGNRMQHPSQRSGHSMYDFSSAALPSYSRRIRGGRDDDGDGDIDDDYSDVAYVPERNRLATRRPRLALENAVGGYGVGSSATVTDGLEYGRTHASTAATAYAGELVFKGAVPVLNEEPSMIFNSQIFNQNPVQWATLGTTPGRRMARPFTVALNRPQVLSSTQISAMYVHGAEQPPGMGILYTNYYRGSYNTIKGQYIMVDENESIVSSWPIRTPFGRYAAHERTCPEDLKAERVSAICFHKESQNLIVASGRKLYEAVASGNTAGDIPVLQFFKPDIRDPSSSAEDVTWQLGPDTLPCGLIPTSSRPSRTRKPVFKIFGGRNIDSVYACVPAPQGSKALCLVGTEDGLRVIDLETTTRLTDVNARYFHPDLSSSATLDVATAARTGPQLHLPRPHDDLRRLPPDGLFMHRQQHLLPHPTDRPGRQSRPLSNLITTVDFVHNHPQLAVAGGRSPVPWLVDLRQRSWHPFGKNTNAVSDEPNAVAHVRSVGEYHVVAAGLRNRMVKYDLRYLKTSRAGGAVDLSGHGRSFAGLREPVQPLFAFTGYYNDHKLFGTGFDVDPTLGIVAAAEAHPRLGDGLVGLTGTPHGGMALFSLSTGERLNTPGLWRLQHHPDGLAYYYTPTERLIETWPNTFTTPRQEYHDDNLPFTIVADEASEASYRPGDDWADYFEARRPDIAALSFAELPHEGTSLFVAVDARVQKYSIRRGNEDIFYGEDEEDEREKKKR